MGNSYLSPQIMMVQQQGERFLIKEGVDSAFIQENLLAKTAYAYAENMSVDGNQIIENSISADSQEDPLTYLTVVDNSNFLAVNSPAELFLPTAQRNAPVAYIVKEGDSPGKIATNFDISLNTVLWANNLNSKSVIQPGDELIILPVSGVNHKVKQGETLSAIASKYKSSIDEIISFNNLKDESSIQIGQELIIPGGVLGSVSASASQKNSSSSGLKAMEEDTSSWPNDKDFFAYPVSGGWNKGVLHYYNAVDIINSCGSPIYAAADGLVIEAKGSGAYNLGYGNMVKIQHYNATRTVYGHLSEVLVKVGDKVYQGDLIGRMGDTGNANGCHLHFEIWEAQNPFAK
ncbi:MAG: peptidoglycan DD-metalloendopeptidase family protein [Candidatus Pacebacteria bacterium]|nr:peptidoglycan DD-metalloendopeptidase family protein [Candidatus Paceibacterota bacterium]